MTQGESNTICAIATATGGGVGIVRISGGKARAVAANLLHPWPPNPPSHYLIHSWIKRPGSGETLDEVLACWMAAPHTYTGEDVVEIQAHGGAAGLARILEAAVEAGAKLAEAGEFTRRAFLNGRMDLVQAEAVALLVAARSERALRLATAQLRGELSKRIEGLCEQTLAVLALIEADIDFPDEDLELNKNVLEDLRELRDQVTRLALSYRRGRAITDGVDVVLAGRPNAGKSSLFNVLIGEERALVDETPGTTRDFIEAVTDMDGILATVVDTAGERERSGAIEERGRELGRKRRKRADVIVVVVDGTLGYGAMEEQLIKDAAPTDVLMVWNKCDLVAPPAENHELAFFPTAALTGQGIPALKRAIRALVDESGDEGTIALTSARQKVVLDEAAEALTRAINACEQVAPPELVAVDLRIALERLGDVTGQGVTDAVLDQVFSRFCIGK